MRPLIVRLAGYGSHSEGREDRSRIRAHASLMCAPCCVNDTLWRMILGTMNTATCEALAQVMPVLLIALIAERVGFNPRKNKRKSRYELAVALTRTFVDFVLALVIVSLELGFLNGIDGGGYKGSIARSYWAFTVLILIAILYRWLLLSPSVQFAFGALLDLTARGLGWLLRWILIKAPERLANALIRCASAVGEVLAAGILTIVRERKPPA